MACDVRVAADNAQLGQPEIKLGLIPGGGGTQRLPRLVGHGRALYLNMSGEFVDAATAERWGLVERVVPAGELLETAKGIAQSFAAQSPVAIGDPARARPRDARPAARGGPEARGRGLPPLPRERGRARGRDGVHREARRPRSPAGEGRGHRGGPERRPPRRRAGARARRRRARARGARGRDQLPRGARPPAAATRSRPSCPGSPGPRSAGELDGRAWIGLKRQSGGGWAERATRRRGLAVPAARGRGLGRGRLVPDDVPDGLDAAHAAGRRSARARACSSRPRPAASARRRCRWSSTLGAQVCAAVGSERKKTAAALARRRSGRHLRRAGRGRPRRRRARPGRRRALHALPRPAEAARHGGRGRLRRRAVGAARHRAARRAQLGRSRASTSAG